MKLESTKILQVASPLPTPLHSGLISSCVLGDSLFLLASRPSGQAGPMWSFNTNLATWREHPSPIGEPQTCLQFVGTLDFGCLKNPKPFKNLKFDKSGNVGEGKPMLAALPPLLVLVGAKPAADARPTNCLQTYDPGQN